MKQEYKYTVTELGPRVSNILEGNDQALVDTYRLGTVSSFNPDESRLDVNILDLEGNFIEYHRDTSDYAVRGVEQGSAKVHQLDVNPASFMEDRTFLGDIIVEYRAYDNLYSKNTDLFITDISSDRTEIRAKSLTLSVQDLRYYTGLFQNKLNNQAYFYGAIFECDETQIPILNVTTEVVDSETIVTFKLYKPLPSDIQLKAKFQVLESLGEPTQFRVHRELVVVEDEIPSLKGPNFEAEVITSTVVTDYKNYAELLSQKSWESSKELYTTFKEAIRHTSVDYEDFSDFVHFSSAFERLENARYKFEKIFDYQVDLEASQSAEKKGDVEKIKGLIDGIIENFDHYENYLWFESGSAAWPKKIDPETGATARPFVPVDHPEDIGDEPGYLTWYNDLANKAEGYDNNNKDILISTIPAAIREDVDHNEPYLIFIHMIGQHFDDLWIYARAITDRYNGDNRLNFGISKELVKDALEAFGIDLQETNQNLNAFFELCQPDGTYDWGEELVGKDLYSVNPENWPESPKSAYVPENWIEQPITVENYRKEVYKRIYHNVPALLKMKGTSRGLRVLLNCFGIPNDILKFKVQGGTNVNNRPFFGPEETINITNEEIDGELIGSPASSKKIRTDNRNTPILEYKNVDGTGSFYTGSTLSRYTSTTSSKSDLTDDSPKVEVGFDLNEAANQFFQKQLSGSEFTVDDVIGDPRNKEDQYGDPWKSLRESLLAGIPESESFRTPAAIIRLVRYFDSTFFRMLKDFIPARASIDSGVIVKDNILHRNRWKGVTVSWMELTKSGSISGSTVTGSHGGAFRHAGYKFDTTDRFNIVSTGDRWVDKGVPSGSREINGELAGTNIKVTDGDLSKYNKHRKDLQPSNNFGYNFWFLDLPDPPFCKSKVVPTYQCEYWMFEALGYSTSGILANIPGSLPKNQIQHVFAETGSEGVYSEVVDSQWTTLTNTNYTFMGWYPSSSLPINNYGVGVETPGRNLDLTDYIYGDKYSWKAVYTSSNNNKMLWMEQLKPGEEYYGQDVLIAWKLLSRGDNPNTTSTQTTGSVITALGEMHIILQSDNDLVEVVLPDEYYFGTNNGYYWAVGVSDLIGSVRSYGIESIGIYRGPFKGRNNAVIDACWFDTYGDWVGDGRNWTWPIAVGSQGNKKPVIVDGYWTVE